MISSSFVHLLEEKRKEKKKGSECENAEQTATQAAGTRCEMATALGVRKGMG